MSNIGNHQKIEQDSLENEYGEEVMYAGWNPIITFPRQQQLASNGQPATTPTSTMVEAESFLKKIYANQR